mmetsp:Transcript_45058/g.143551  ORF Transcript_45058/g.143551 Transcript_45058/m.143551 type:complete len:236 (+) Transcript_45058:1046-1753(+)
MATAVVSLLDLEAALQQGFLLPHVAELAVGRGQVVQCHGRVDMAHAKVSLLYLQALLEEVFLHLDVSELAVGACQLREYRSSGHMAWTKALLQDLQAPLQELLARPCITYLGMGLCQVTERVRYLRRVRPMPLSHLRQRELREFPERPALVCLLAGGAAEVVPVTTRHEVLHQAAQMHELGRAAAEAGVDEIPISATSLGSLLPVLAILAQAESAHTRLAPCTRPGHCLRRDQRP